MLIKHKYTFAYVTWSTLIAFTLSACFHPPYNNFHKDPPNLKRTAMGLGIGAGVGTLLGSTVAGLLIGGTAGTIINLYRTNKQNIINEIRKEDMQYIEYGDTMTLIVPTDHYYLFNSAQLNDICYEGLNNIVRLLKLYPKSRIYVAGFTDNVGPMENQLKLSQARAEAMLTFLWAHDIPAHLLKAKGYGKHFSIGDNSLIHGSAYNRRIEIQWFSSPNEEQARALQGGMK